jgi:hypothetical protein
MARIVQGGGHPLDGSVSGMLCGLQFKICVRIYPLQVKSKRHAAKEIFASILFLYRIILKSFSNYF